jgi:hypothetical protein
MINLELKNGITLKTNTLIGEEIVKEFIDDSPRLVKDLTLDNITLENLINTREGE